MQTKYAVEEANIVEKETQANILSWCVTEFKESAADLPRFKDIPNSETGRACKQAALAFWGRTCMLMQDWAGGAAAYKEIIDYGDNSIHPVYRELFRRHMRQRRRNIRMRHCRHIRHS